MSKEIKNPFSGRVIFDHLPKTAGQSISRWLCNELGDDNVAENKTGAHQSLIWRYGGKRSVICGHMDFYGEGLDPRYFYITCLRDPVDRVLSWLYFIDGNKQHLLSTGNHYLWKCANEVITTEGDFIDLPFSESISNLYVSHFSAIVDSYPKSDVQRYNLANEAIEKYNVIGFYDEMGEFMTAVSHLIGLGNPKKLPRINVTPNRPTQNHTSQKLINKIKDINALDIEFYHQTKYSNRTQKVFTNGVPEGNKWAPYQERKLPIYQKNEFKLLTIETSAVTEVPYGSILNTEIQFSTEEKLENLEIDFTILDSALQIAFETSTSKLRSTFTNLDHGVYRVNLSMVANLPADDFSVNIRFSTYAQNNKKLLANYPNAIRFRVEKIINNSSGYAYLPMEVACKKTNRNFPGSANINQGRIYAVGEINKLPPRETFVLQIKICNESTDDWQGTFLTPLLVTHEWVDEISQKRIYEGVTPIPGNCIPSRSEISVNVLIQSPDAQGHFTLILSLSQTDNEQVNHADFKPAVLHVKIENSNGITYLSGNDARLRTMTGERTKEAIKSSGRDGFFIYGPYLPLTAGNYYAEFEFIDVINLDEGFIDIAVDGGTTICQTSIQSIANQNFRPKLKFYLEKENTSIETRVFASAKNQFTLKSITIAPEARNFQNENN